MCASCSADICHLRLVYSIRASSVRGLLILFSCWISQTVKNMIIFMLSLSKKVTKCCKKVASCYHVLLFLWGCLHAMYVPDHWPKHLLRILCTLHRIISSNRRNILFCFSEGKVCHFVFLGLLFFFLIYSYNPQTGFSRLHQRNNSWFLCYVK